MTKRSFTSRTKKALKKLIEEKFPWMLIHVHECGNVAMYLKHHPVAEQRIDAEDCIYPDGSVPKQGEAATCFSCKRQMGHEDFEMECVRHI